MEWFTSGTGLLVSVSVVAAIGFLIPIFLKRIKTVGWGYSLIGGFFGMFMNFDIPVISGSGEEKIKDRLWSTIGDLFTGAWLRFMRKRMSKPKDMAKLIKQVDEFAENVIRSPKA